MAKSLFFSCLIGALILLAACDKNDNFQLISTSQEIQLGQQLDSTIDNSPQEYPILDPTEYPEAYDYLENIFMEILNSGAVSYRDEFPWQIEIIQDDETLNAFAAPGGYVYVYTGLIKYLDSEDDLAGVLGHEIGHADLRHSARNIQRQYGLSILLSLLVGENAGQLTQIAAQLASTTAGLAFSREFETEADEKSVEYLASTPYNCAGAGSFFQKITEDGQSSGVPEFLSTHPNPDDRLENINAKAQEVGCSTESYDPPTYQDFQQMLP